MPFILSTPLPLHHPILLSPSPMVDTLRHRTRPPQHSPHPRPRHIQVMSKAALERQEEQPASFLSGPRGAAAGIILHLATAAVFLRIAERWALLDGLYFAVVVATTVGYGDMAPVRPVSKIFVALYSIVSVVLIAGLLQRLVEKVADAHKGIANNAVARMLNADGGKLEEAKTGDMVQVAAIGVKRAQLRLRATVMMLIGACVSGALLYGTVLNMSFVDLFYFLVVTMTTVGLGDIHPISRVGKAFAAVWLVLTSLGFASILGQYADLKVKQREMELAKRLLHGEIGEKMFSEIDGDGSNTLTEAEFLGYMMCKLGKASPDDVHGILGRFRELDTDNSGSISRTEVITQNKKKV